VRCTFKIPGLGNFLQTFRRAAAGAGVFKGFTFSKGETFFTNDTGGSLFHQHKKVKPFYGKKKNDYFFREYVNR